MEQYKSKQGDIKPLFQQVGWQVCKKASEKPEEEEWIAVEKESEAEILSFVLSYKKA